MPGEKGETGEKGERGEPGEPGAPGETGQPSNDVIVEGESNAHDFSQVVPAAQYQLRIHDSTQVHLDHLDRQDPLGSWVPQDLWALRGPLESGTTEPTSRLLRRWVSSQNHSFL